jgi:hypothetical protein
MDLTAQPIDLNIITQLLDSFGQPDDSYAPPMELNFTAQPLNNSSFTVPSLDLNFTNQYMDSFSFTSQPLDNPCFTSTTQPMTIETNNSTTSSFTTYMDMLGPITKPQVRT